MLDGNDVHARHQQRRRQPPRRLRGLQRARCGPPRRCGDRNTVGLKLTASEPGGRGLHADCRTRRRARGYPGDLTRRGHLHARQQQRPALRLHGHDRRADGRQPHQPLLLEPGRRGLGDDLRPPAAAQRRPLHARRRDPDPDGRHHPGRPGRRSTSRASTRSASASAATTRSSSIGRGYDHNWVLNRAQAPPASSTWRPPSSTRRSGRRADDPDHRSPGSSSTRATSSTARSTARAAASTARATGWRWRPSTSPTRRTSRTSRRRSSIRADVRHHDRLQLLDGRRPQAPLAASTLRRPRLRPGPPAAPERCAHHVTHATDTAREGRRLPCAARR